MLSSRTAAKASLSGQSIALRNNIRSLSVLSSSTNSNNANQFKPSNATPHNYQQQRTLLGIVHAIDKRVYRWAQGVLPPISKTENIALGCGTIGTLLSSSRLHHLTLSRFCHSILHELFNSLIFHAIHFLSISFSISIHIAIIRIRS